MNRRVAFVTGASSGIGRGLSVRLAQEGYAVGLAARRLNRLEEVAGDIRDYGGDSLPLVCDVGHHGQVEAAVRACEEALGPVDLLVANAGRGDRTRVTDLSAADVERVMSVNFLGAVYAVEAVLPGMLSRGSGQLVAIASAAGFGGIPGAAAYSASKGAMINFFESLRLDLEPRGIAVTVVSPGFVDTEMTASDGKARPFMVDLDDAVEHIARAILARKKSLVFPLARGGDGVGRPGVPQGDLRLDRGTGTAGLTPDRAAVVHSCPVRDPVALLCLSSPPLSSSQRHGGPMNQAAVDLVRERRRSIEEALGQPLVHPDPEPRPLTADQRAHLVGEARNLFLNELEWERITDEEKLDGGPIPELVFPGFLAFIRGLLMREAMADSLAPPDPRPEVVDEVLLFLAEQVLSLEAAVRDLTDQDTAAEDAITTRRLVDQVLYRFHGLSREDIARVESARGG